VSGHVCKYSTRSYPIEVENGYPINKVKRMCFLASARDNSIGGGEGEGDHTAGVMPPCMPLFEHPEMLLPVFLVVTENSSSCPDKGEMSHLHVPTLTIESTFFYLQVLYLNRKLKGKQ